MVDFKNTILKEEKRIKEAMMKCDVDAYRDGHNNYYLYLDLDGTMRVEKVYTQWVCIPVAREDKSFLIHRFHHPIDMKEFINSYAFNNIDEVKESIKFRFGFELKSVSKTKNYYNFIIKWLEKKSVSESDVSSFLKDIFNECLDNFTSDDKRYNDIFEECLNDSFNPRKDLFKLCLDNAKPPKKSKKVD